MVIYDSSNVTSLLGATVHVRDKKDLGFESFSEPYVARVLAVQLPAPNSNIECSILLEDLDSPGSLLDYLPLDRLEISLVA